MTAIAFVLLVAGSIGLYCYRKHDLDKAEERYNQRRLNK